MPLKFYDRVQETSTTTGTGTYTLAGASVGYRTFTSVLSDADLCYYVASEPGGSGWEVGKGTFTASGTTLARTTIIASSNSNNAVNWSAGSRLIALTAPAAAFNGGWELISSTSASAASSVAFTGFDSNKYEEYWLSFWGLLPVGGNGIVALRTSTDGGSSYDSGASAYVSVATFSDGGYMNLVANTTTFGYVTNNSILTTTNYPVHGSIFIRSPQTAARSAIRTEVNHEFTAGSLWVGGVGSIWRDTNADVDAFNIFLNTGNTFDGEFRFYGRRK